jgi:micrococcal nuclease
MRGHLAITALAVVAVVAVAGCADPPAASPGPTTTEAAAANATVIDVTDGDTIKVRIDGREEDVRLIGIDTPEVHDPREPVQCFGAEASAYLASLLPNGTRVRLERDVEPRDQYTRLLTYVYRAHDGLFVNLALAEQGYANVLRIAPNVAHAEDFRAAVADARRSKRGLWGACSSFGAPVDR